MHTTLQKVTFNFCINHGFIQLKWDVSQASRDLLLASCIVSGLHAGKKTAGRFAISQGEAGQAL
jgi:hypothetical protein